MFRLHRQVGVLLPEIRRCRPSWCTAVLGVSEGGCRLPVGAPQPQICMGVTGVFSQRMLNQQV